MTNLIWIFKSPTVLLSSMQTKHRFCVFEWLNSTSSCCVIFPVPKSQFYWKLWDDESGQLRSRFGSIAWEFKLKICEPAKFDDNKMCKRLNRLPSESQSFGLLSALKIQIQSKTCAWKATKCITIKNCLQSMLKLLLKFYAREWNSSEIFEKFFVSKS